MRGFLYTRNNHDGEWKYVCAWMEEKKQQQHQHQHRTGNSTNNNNVNNITHTTHTELNTEPSERETATE